MRDRPVAMHNAEKPNPPASVRDTWGQGKLCARPTLDPETAPGSAHKKGEYRASASLEALMPTMLRLKKSIQSFFVEPSST